MLSKIITAAALAGSALAAPALSTRQSTNIDATVLNFALTLEHLENFFYKQALNKFSPADFARAGHEAFYYNNLRYISYDEQTHVTFLTNALMAAGATPVVPCTYNFPYTDVNSFITLSSVLEGVGTSAYLGAAPLITSKGYLTAAGSILVTEALHTSYQRAAIKEIPMANPFGTPIDPMSAYTLAAAFITSCPPGNASSLNLGFSAFPTLTYAGKAMKRDLVERQGSGYSNIAGFPTSGYCYPTTYYAAQDQGQLNSNNGAFASQVSQRCEAACSASSGCQAFVGIYQVAANPTNLATSTCFFYSSPPTAARGCADHPYSMIAEQKGGAAAAPTSSTPAAAPTTTSAPAAAPTSTGGSGTPTSSSPATSSSSSTAMSLPVAGNVVKFTTAGNIPAGSFVTFVSGLMTVSVPGTISGNSVTAAIPSAAQGQTYVFLTKSDDSTSGLKDTDVLAGPAIVEVMPPSV